MGKAGLFVVLLISAILIVVALKVMLVKSKEPAPNVTGPIERAHGIECLNNLRNIRGKIDMYNMEKGNYPSSLSDLDGVSSTCPVSKESYQYDNSTGRVTCPTHPRY